MSGFTPCDCHQCRTRREFHLRLNNALAAALKDNWIPIEALLTDVFDGNPVQAWKRRDDQSELETYFG